MSETIDQPELCYASAKVLRKIQAGHTLIVSRNCEPVAEFMPIQSRGFVPRAAINKAEMTGMRGTGDRDTVESMTGVTWSMYLSDASWTLN
jgi:antitoxin (DNA-binding transcriptional repressor) of toxin-antitoxin stability system